MISLSAATLLAILAGPPAQTAPVPVPPGRLFVLEAPAKLRFLVPTSVGPVEGTVDVIRIDGRGVEGWGRFELRLVIDPDTVDTGDVLRDRHIAQRVLGSESGDLFVASTDRLPSQPLSDGGFLLGASSWMDARRGRQPVSLRYRWEGGAERGTFRFEHEATLENLGLPPPAHPFVKVTGPLKLSFSATLVRPR